LQLFQNKQTQICFQPINEKRGIYLYIRWCLEHREGRKCFLDAWDSAVKKVSTFKGEKIKNKNFFITIFLIGWLIDSMDSTGRVFLSSLQKHNSYLNFHFLSVIIRESSSENLSSLGFSIIIGKFSFNLVHSWLMWVISNLKLGNEKKSFGIISEFSAGLRFAIPHSPFFNAAWFSAPFNKISPTFFLFYFIPWSFFIFSFPLYFCLPYCYLIFFLFFSGFVFIIVT